MHTLFTRKGTGRGYAHTAPCSHPDHTLFTGLDSACTVLLLSAASLLGEPPSWVDSNTALGKSKVFLSEAIVSRLEAAKLAAWAGAVTGIQAVARRYIACRAVRALAAIAAADAAAREALRAYAASISAHNLPTPGGDLNAASLSSLPSLSPPSLPLPSIRGGPAAPRPDLGAPRAAMGGGCAHLDAARSSLEQLAVLWRDGGEALAACLPQEAYTRLQMRNRGPIHTPFTHPFPRMRHSHPIHTKFTHAIHASFTPS